MMAALHIAEIKSPDITDITDLGVFNSNNFKLTGKEFIECQNII